MADYANDNRPPARLPGSRGVGHGCRHPGAQAPTVSFQDYRQAKLAAEMAALVHYLLAFAPRA